MAIFKSPFGIDYVLLPHLLKSTGNILTNPGQVRRPRKSRRRRDWLRLLVMR